MIKYHTWNLTWWLRFNGSSIFAWASMIPATVAFFFTWFLQEHKEFTVTMTHPYLHNMLAVLTSFVLTYRSQLAYQRFWEGRTMLQQMSARWTDAATQVFWHL